MKYLNYLESVKLIDGVEELSIYDTIDFIDEKGTQPFSLNELKIIANNFHFFELRLCDYSFISSEHYKMKINDKVSLKGYKKYNKWDNPLIINGDIFNYINYINYKHNRKNIISFSIMFNKELVTNLYFLMKLKDDYYLLYDFSEYELKKDYNIYIIDHLSTLKKCKLKTSII